MYYTYVLKSISYNYLYKGSTNNLAKRLNQHSTGQTRSTKHFAPYTLVFVQISDTRSDAMEIERFLKTGTGREFLKQIIGPVV